MDKGTAILVTLYWELVVPTKKNSINAAITMVTADLILLFIEGVIRTFTT